MVFRVTLPVFILFRSDVWLHNHHAGLLHLSLGQKFTDVLCNRAEVWHLWGAGLLVVPPDARCPQAELLGGSVQLQTVDSGIFRHLFMLSSLLRHFCTSLEVNMRHVKRQKKIKEKGSSFSSRHEGRISQHSSQK